LNSKLYQYVLKYLMGNLYQMFNRTHMSIKQVFYGRSIRKALFLTNYLKCVYEAVYKSYWLPNRRIEGCEKKFTDVASGVKQQRPGLEEAVKYCRQGKWVEIYRDSVNAKKLHLKT